jgi:amino acid transporter
MKSSSPIVRILTSLVISLPIVTFASSGYLEGVANTFKSVVSILLPAFTGLVIIGFAYGLFIYVKGGAKEQEEGKKIMIWGTLAVVILLSIYGITGLLQDLLGVTNQTIEVPTTFKGSSDSSGYFETDD